MGYSEKCGHGPEMAFAEMRTQSAFCQTAFPPGDLWDHGVALKKLRRFLSGIRDGLTSATSDFANKNVAIYTVLLLFLMPRLFETVSLGHL